MKKRILSVLITLVMLIGLVTVMSVSASAVETTESKWAFGTAETAPDDSAYTNSGTLAEAFTAANGNEDTTNTVTYVKLNKDVSMTHTSLATALTLNEGKAMVLDLNSKTYSSSTTSTSGGDATYGIKTELNSLLTVKNGTISVSSSNDGYAIGIKSKGNLNVLNCTIEASKSNANSGAYGISYTGTGGVATITNCTITATSVGDRAQGIEIGTTTPALTIADCTVNAIGGDEAYAFYASEYFGKMEFDVAGTITATCENGAFNSKPTTNEVTVTAGEAEGTATDADASADATYANKYVKIEPVKYDLWVGGVQVTSANKDNIVVPGATGSATYDPDTKTLTLNNFSYTGEGRVTQYYNAAISTDSINLNVKLVGTNTIICQSDDESVKCRAICVWYGLDHSAGNLTIYGTDKETDKLICTANDGISSVRSLTVKDATVQTNGALISSAVSDVTITDSIISADLEAGDITLENSVLEISKTASTGDNFTITNSTVTGGGLSASDYASVLTVTGSQVNVRNIDAFAFMIEGNSNVTAQVICVFQALIVTDSSVHVTGCELPELGLEGSLGILLLKLDGVVAIDNSTVEVYGGKGAYLYTDDFLTFTPFAPSFVDGEEPADPYDYTVYAGESAPGQCADASDVNTYANKYVKIAKGYTVTTVVTTGGTVAGGGTYQVGATVTLTATPNSGYKFVNWTKNGSVVSTDATYTFTATESAEYVANFQQNTPSAPPAPSHVFVTLVYGNGIASETKRLPVDTGAPAAPAVNGKVFAGWYDDAACTQAHDFSTPFTANDTLYAKYVNIPERSRVSFVADGRLVGIILYRPSQTELTFIPKVPAKEGYVGTWETYTLNGKNMIVRAVYTPIN